MNEKQFYEYIAQTKQAVDTILVDFFAKRVDKAGLLSDRYGELVDLTAQATLRGGKRLRPALAILGYQIAGGKDIQKMYVAASALEIYHNFLLIHDDIIDRDASRHGGATIHEIYREEFLDTLSAEDAEHFAMSMALLAGDINAGLSYEILLEAGFSSKKTLSAVARLNATTFDTAAGEQLDTLGSFSERYSKAELIAIAVHKTADYSITMPLQYGALLAGTSQTKLDLMEHFGKNIGIAFQLTDDILGIFGDTSKTGKPNISDLQEAKQTILMYYAMQMASSDQKKVLVSQLGNKMAQTKELAIIRQIITECGALDKTRSEIDSYYSLAVNSITGITKQKQSQDLLHFVAKYCIRREY